MQLSDVEREGEAFLSSIARERALVAAGLKPELELTLIFSRFAELCSVETYQRVRDEVSESGGAQTILELLAGSVLQDAVSHLDEAIAAHELRAQIEWFGQLVPLRSARVESFVEPDRDRRHRLDEAVRAEVRALERPRVERIQTIRAAVERLEWPDPLSMWAELRGLDLAALATVARGILDTTAEQYDEAIRDQVVHLQLDRADVWEVDLAWILRGVEYDPVFAHDKLLPTANRTLAALGIGLQDQANVRLDLGTRPVKQARPGCFPVAVPDEVLLVSRPLGGRLDYAALWSLVGEGESYAHTDRTQPLATRRLGDGAMRTGYGSLFRLLLLDPAWLRSYLETDAIRDPLRLAGVEVLANLRRAAAMLLYELELWRAEEPDQMREVYADSLSDALRVGVFPEQYLDGIENPLASANELRGWMLAGQLVVFLRAEFDEEWFRSSRTGRFLADLWRGGQRYTAEEMARHLGFEGLDSAPLVAEAATVIGG